MHTAQLLLNCRSIEDMASVQTQFLQTSFDRLVEEANKMAQATASFAKERAAPLNNQLESLMQSLNRAA